MDNFHSPWNGLLQEREHELALRTSHEEVQQKLQEKEEEVRLAIEERELQKMAAVSGLDEQKDGLLQQIEALNSVRECALCLLSISGDADYCFENQEWKL